MACIFKDSNGNHLKNMQKSPYLATLDFASIHNLTGSEASRRDDLEQLGYTLIYLANKKLPWTKSNGQDPDGNDVVKKVKKRSTAKLMEMKLGTETNELLAGTPQQMQDFMIHVWRLGF